MLKICRLFGSRAPARARGPQETLVWAVGDIHGRLDLLDGLLATILADFEAAGPRSKVLIFLGDYVDRGPQSAQVLERLHALRQMTAFATRLLRGNHEDRLLAFLDQPETGRTWCEYGGRETLWSYGVSPPPMDADAEAWRRTATLLGERMPTYILDLLRRLEGATTLGDYFFAHAGARWGVPLDRQDPHDLMWIRKDFLDDDRRFEKVVVHGHTPRARVHADRRRIGLDTGAYATGVLTGLRVFEDLRWTAQATMHASGIETIFEDMPQ